MTRASSRKRLRPAGGFTLLELLVALALLALAALLVPGLWRLGQKAWATVASSEASAELAAARTQVARRIAEALPHYTHEAAGTGIALHGTPAGLLILNAASGARRPGLTAVEIRIEGSALLLEERRVGPGGTLAGLAGGERRVLIAGIAGGGFRYFGAARPGESPAWREAWPRTDALPQLVRLEIALGPGDRRVWLPLVVEPRLRPPG
jgi:prepilin-type N-terminal cleavage/methylation domain-containing protein